MTAWDRFLLLFVAVVVVWAVQAWLLVSLGYAHPGRLDARGCHHTRQEFRYETGEVLPAETYHCHRALGTSTLDSREVLGPKEAPGHELEPRPLEVR